MTCLTWTPVGMGRNLSKEVSRAATTSNRAAIVGPVWGSEAEGATSSLPGVLEANLGSLGHPKTGLCGGEGPGHREPQKPACSLQALLWEQQSSCCVLFLWHWGLNLGPLP